MLVQTAHADVAGLPCAGQTCIGKPQLPMVLISSYLHSQLPDMHAAHAALLAELSNPLHGSSTCCHPDCACLAHADQCLALGAYIRLGYLQAGKCSRGRCSSPEAQGMLPLEPTQHIPATRLTYVTHSCDKANQCDTCCLWQAFIASSWTKPFPSVFKWGWLRQGLCCVQVTSCSAEQTSTKM